MIIDIVAAVAMGTADPVAKVPSRVQRMWRDEPQKFSQSHRSASIASRDAATPVGIPFSLTRSQGTRRVHKGRENLFKVSKRTKL